jgi:beta-lactamase class A
MSDYIKIPFISLLLIITDLAKGRVQHINAPSAQEQIETIASQINAQVGVSALLLETGDTVNYHSDQKYPMQSTYNIVPTGVSPIRTHYPKGVSLTIMQLLHYNVSESDGTACDVLLHVLGGCEQVNRYVHNLGIADIAISTTEMTQTSDELVQYRNWVRPTAMLQLLKIFYASQALNSRNRNILLNLMIHSVPGSKRLKDGVPANTIVAHKPGTSCTWNGLTRATNDIGIINLPNGKHLLIAVFVSDAYVYQGNSFMR